MKILVTTLFYLGVLMVLAAFIGRFIGNPATIAGISRTGVLLYGIALMVIAVYLRTDTCCK